MKLFKNESGFSLIQVMVAASLMSGLSVFLMQLQQNTVTGNNVNNTPFPAAKLRGTLFEKESSLAIASKDAAGNVKKRKEN